MESDTAEHSEGRLSRIETYWSLVRQADQGLPDAVQAARAELINRYGGAVRRYLRQILQNADAADEIFQEFSLELAKGKLAGADPQRGRFRNFVKGVLFHLVADYRRQRQRWPAPLPEEDAAVPITEPGELELDRRFIESWRDELLARAWAALDQAQKEGARHFYDVLRLRSEHPKMPSAEMAEELSLRLGRSFTAAGVRQTLHRARQKFVAILINEVSHSLEDASDVRVEEELADLGLLEYCRPARGQDGVEA